VDTEYCLFEVPPIVIHLHLSIFTDDCQVIHQSIKLSKLVCKAVGDIILLHIAIVNIICVMQLADHFVIHDHPFPEHTITNVL